MRWFAAFSLLGIFSVLLAAMEPGKNLPPAAPKPPGGNREWLHIIAAREKSMTRVTDQPQSMDMQVVRLCRLPLPTELPEANPHRGHYVHVYVTNGEEKKIRTGEGTYPVGTLIVKEKLPGPLSDLDVSSTAKKPAKQTPPLPELFTVMLKREAGYHPECGDWEFMVVSGDMKQVLARGKLDSCVECHKGYKQTDYVTQLYPLPK
jgi:hypothetical protein